MPSSSSPQQNWVLAGGPSKVSRNYNYRNSSSSDEDDETMGGMVVDVAKDDGKEALKGFVIEGEINVEDFGDGMVSGMGGKLGEKAGGKLGGKLGKKLGNEEMGEEIGGMVGDEVGGMAADAGKEALGNLAAGEDIELSPPEMPDLNKFSSRPNNKKCTIV